MNRRSYTRIKLLTVLLLVVLMTACGAQKGDEPLTDIPAMISVDLKVMPEQISSEQTVTIQAKVTQGEQLVEDADVIFEIWKKGDKAQAERYQPSAQGGGVYSLEQTFEEDGLYYVTSHVTVGVMHNMPTKPIIVGHVPESELEDTSEVPDPQAEMDQEDM